ncbi:MAG TPA: pentapeptide repeat-containing protein [Methylocella sp.]
MVGETEHMGPAAPPDAAVGDRAPAPGEPPPLPATAMAFAGTAKDLQALRDAVVDAASVGAGLWFSYLFVLLYLLIAVGGVTHRDLFLQSPVKLPFLNVDLPLLGFFWLGPLIFLIVHAYVLLHFVLLAGKVGDFDTELREQIPDEDVRRRLRRQLPSNIFVQFLAGSREVRTGVMGFMLRLIAQISLVIGPVALLVFFELQFLPYHDWAITWWHRIAVAADIVLLWLLWPSIARGETARLTWRDLQRAKIWILAFVSLTPVLLVTTIATFPGEWAQNNLPSLRFIPWPDERGRWFSPHELLVAGEVDLAARKPKSLWSNRLVLPGFDVIDHTKFDSEAKIEALPETISLRARHLEGAVLIGAKLRKADFTSARLQGARLDGSDLRNARFECDDRGSAEPQCAQLQGASLNGAQLQGASLDGAQLQDARLLDGVQLQGASLKGTKLQGAWLVGAQLQGASLDYAQLQGAQLNFVQLQGASLTSAELQGASLDGAKLQGASLNWTQLQAASLKVASLDGAYLQNAQLQGAQLDRSDLRGANFECDVIRPEPLQCTRLEGASLKQVFAWRADARRADIWGARVVDPETGQKYLCEKNGDPSACDWSAESFDELKRLITDQIPEGEKRRAAMERIALSLDPTKPMEGEDEMARFWEAQAHSSDAHEDYEKRVAGVWRETGCAEEGAPYVLRSFLSRLEVSWDSPFDEQSPQLPALAKAFLDEAHCFGAHGLTGAEKAKLKAIRDRPPTPASKP